MNDSMTLVCEKYYDSVKKAQKREMTERREESFIKECLAQFTDDEEAGGDSCNEGNSKVLILGETVLGMVKTFAKAH